MIIAGEIKECPLCGAEEIQVHNIDFSREIFRLTCKRCGQYEMSGDFLSYITPAEQQELGYILSAIARELYETKDKAPLFLYKDLETYKTSYLVPQDTDIERKALKLIDRLKEQSGHFGKWITIDLNYDFPLAYAHDRSELEALIALLIDTGYLIDKSRDSHTWTVIVGAKSFQINPNANEEASDQGFIAAWFDPSMNESIAAAEEAVVTAGFTPMCIKDEHFAERIMDKALAEIRKSRFLIVDLTGMRQSVFLETGFALGLNKEIIFIYNKSLIDSPAGLEFYVKHYQCYGYENPEELKEILNNAIKARLPKSNA